MDASGKAAIDTNRKSLQSAAGKPEGSLSSNKPFTMQVMLGTMVSLFVPGCTGSQSTPGNSGGPGHPEDPTPRVTSFGKMVWWEPARSKGRERMRARASEEGTSYDGVYKALWDRSREPFALASSNYGSRRCSTVTHH